jgi:hypothetical protein
MPTYWNGQEITGNTKFNRDTSFTDLGYTTVSIGGIETSVSSEGIVQSDLIMWLDSSDLSSYDFASDSSNWFDLSGNGNNVRIFNDPSFDSVSSSIIFDGVNNFGQNESAISPSEVTVSAWVLAATPVSGTLVSQGVSYETNRISDSRSRTNSAGLSSMNRSVSINSIGFDAGIWYMITGVFSSNGHFLYVNDVLKSQDLTPYSSPDDPFPFTIAAITTDPNDPSSPTSLFNGQVAMVLVYNRALSDTEISNNYTITNRFG